MAALNELIQKIENPELRAQIQEAANKLAKQKKFGLVFEEHLPECTPLYEIPVRKGLKVSLRAGKANETYIVLKVENGKALCLPRNGNQTIEFDVSDLVTTAELGDPIYPCLQPLGEVCNAPESDLWHTLIEADNYHALQLLEYLYAGKVDCIYIDPPYNTGAKDWKYNNDYVDSNDEYRHSKWLSMMKKRLEIAKRLLNPLDSVLIVTIDEKEYLHLGCLIEELFPEAAVQMIVDVINPRGTNRSNEFSRVEEYLFICRFGNSSVVKNENNMLGNTDETAKARVWFGFNRGNNARATANSQFYPIYIDKTTKRIVEVGEALPLDKHPEDVPQIDGLKAVFPVNSHGNESIWRCIPETAREWIKKGYVKVSKYDEKNNRWTLSYIPSGLQKKIEAGVISVEERASDGSLDIKHVSAEGKEVSPRTVWYQKYHNATDYGASIIKNIIPNHHFQYPKSLYAVKDTINFFLKNKPESLIVDFFAGSGTTLHAVNLLNAEDGGHRRCIMVTNNEISEAERKGFESRGLKPGDPEWENRGIARYVTWPRTVCSIEGHDINGKPLEGNYITTGERELPMADGFKSNAIFFKLGFLDKTRVSLGMQFKELLSTLWMKAGAIGKCPAVEASVPDMLVLPENKMAILNDENHFSEFAEQIALHPEIEVVWLVTDYESSFVAMTQALEGKKTYQLYRDYLENFRINARRNSR